MGSGGWVGHMRSSDTGQRGGVSVLCTTSMVVEALLRGFLLLFRGYRPLEGGREGK